MAFNCLYMYIGTCTQCGPRLYYRSIATSTMLNISYTTKSLFALIGLHIRPLSQEFNIIVHKVAEHKTKYSIGPHRDANVVAVGSGVKVRSVTSEGG